MSELDDPLGDDLRRLFADDRLEIAPSANAESLIVAGARRRRRRREVGAVTVGVTVVGALFGVSLMLSPIGDGRDDRAVALPPGTSQSVEPAESTTTRTSEPAPSSELPETKSVTGTPLRLSSQPPSPTRASDEAPPVFDSPFADSAEPSVMPAGAFLGPDGYGQLQLGMTFDEAKQTGMLTEDAQPPSGCGSYKLAEGDDQVSTVTISDSFGVVRFLASSARTPEGEGTGSTLEALKNTYPDGWEHEAGYTAPSGQGGLYEFLLGEDATTYQFSLIANTKHGC